MITRKVSNLSTKSYKTKILNFSENVLNLGYQSEGVNLDISISLSSSDEEDYIDSNKVFDPKYNQTLVAFDEESANKLWKGRQAEYLRK